MAKMKGGPFDVKGCRDRLRDLDKREHELKLRQRVRERETELGLRRSFKKPSWAKLMMAFIFLMCGEIIIYAEVVMWLRYDLSALYALIGVPAAMFGVFWAYCEKAKRENTKGGITYDMAMREEDNDSPGAMG